MGSRSSFAVLATPDAPWPAPKPGERNAGGKFKGYRTDKRAEEADTIDTVRSYLPTVA